MAGKAKDSNGLVKTYHIKTMVYIFILIIFNEQSIRILIRLTGNNRIFTHINGGILPDYNRQQNNLLQNK